MNAKNRAPLELVATPAEKANSPMRRFHDTEWAEAMGEWSQDYHPGVAALKDEDYCIWVDGELTSLR